MSDKKRKIFLVLCLVGGIIFQSCNIDNCSKNFSFKLDYHLFDHVYVEGQTYSDLVNNSLEGDSVAIIRLSLLRDFDGWAFQEHGMVILDIIERISEKKYCQIINDLSVEEKKSIYDNVCAGLEGKGIFAQRSCNEVIRLKYPQLYDCLDLENRSSNWEICKQKQCR